MSLEGEKDFQRALKRLDADVRGRAFADSMNEAMHLVETAAKRNVPVRTGLLRRSIRSMIDGAGDYFIVGHVGPGEETEVHTGFDRRSRRKASQDYLSYGLFIEYGSRNTQKDPWLRPALERSAGPVERVFKKHLEAVVAKHNR